MSAHARFRAMLLLGLLNPHADLGHAGCGLVCEAKVATPLAGLRAN
ncbi:MAG: hypothetical protein GVY27_12215 [Deinococcus-Thermus bacterium]|nr:hypothetical protein [Deinococcota bacterium]